jgi:hypothetical protein
LDIPEKTRLEKLLGMLGSSFDGERANAARMIAAMAEKQKLTVVELVYGASTQHHGGQQQKPRPGQPQSDSGPQPDMLEALAKIAENRQRHELFLTEWEFQFAVDVSARYSRDYELSVKQLAIVEKILRKAQRAAEK